MSHHRVERMGLHDIGAVVSMWEAFETERGFVPTEAQALAFGEVMLDAARPDSLDAVFVASVGKKPVGFVWTRFCETPYGPYPRVVLGDAFYVRPRYRHHEGLGHALYEVAADRAAALKATLAGECRIGDLETWTKKGFVPVSVTFMRPADAPPQKGD